MGVEVVFRKDKRHHVMVLFFLEISHVSNGINYLYTSNFVGGTPPPHSWAPFGHLDSAGFLAGGTKMVQKWAKIKFGWESLGQKSFFFFAQLAFPPHFCGFDFSVLGLTPSRASSSGRIPSNFRSPTPTVTLFQNQMSPLSHKPSHLSIIQGRLPWKRAFPRRNGPKLTKRGIQVQGGRGLFSKKRLVGALGEIVPPCQKGFPLHFALSAIGLEHNGKFLPTISTQAVKDRAPKSGTRKIFFFGL